MKKFFCMMVPVLVASMVSLSSCTKNGKENPEEYFFYEKFTVETGDLEVKLYDLSVIFYNVSQERMMTLPLELGYFEYFGGEYRAKLPEGFDFKVVGKLKANASEIVDKLVEEGNPMTFGEKYDCEIAFYKDKDKKAAHQILMKSTENRISTMKPENFSKYLENPEITIVEYSTK